ncbi:phosphate ABC transporter substrate-binding protein [Firmicutes bacterium AM41-11]|nr:phosphate ABC transporter substrate-binding protein [Firmicutes bacterium AM41-11]
MKKGASLFLAAAMTAGLLTGCGSSSTDSSSSDLEGTITAAGSSALKPLVDEASQKFIEKNPNVSITVDAGGSGEGLKQVSEGTVTIGNSDVSAEEKLDADQAKELVDHQVCVVTMAPIVNKDVTEAGVKDLSTDQLIGIFTGQITNWKDVGGPEEDIVLVTRPSSSGTRATFEKYALNGNAEAENKSMETDDSGVLLKNVSDTKGAIGYVALSYLVDNKDVDAVSIDGVAPTLENTYNGTYKVWTMEHMYTKGKGSKADKAFIKYIMSDDFAKTCEKLGYGVSSKMESTEH